MEIRFFRFLVAYVKELGVDLNTLITAFAEEIGAKGVQERDLRARLQELGFEAEPSLSGAVADHAAIAAADLAKKQGEAETKTETKTVGTKS